VQKAAAFFFSSCFKLCLIGLFSELKQQLEAIGWLTD